MSSVRKSGMRVRVGGYAALAALGAFSVGGVLDGCSARAPTSNPNETGMPATGTKATGGFVRLERGAHPLALAKYDLGPLNPTKRIENLSVVFKLTPAQLADRDALLTAQLDPASPSYHQWLTPETYAARFGANAADIARTKDWLGSQGFDVKQTSRLGARVNFGGTVSQLQDAFQTEVHRYRVGGENHYAMASAPSIPAALSDVILALHNSHDFYPRPVLRQTKVAPMATCPTGDKYCKGVGIAPPDWDALYDVPAAYDGAGVDLVVVGVAVIAQGDIDAFRSTYGFAASTVDMIYVPESGPPQGQNGAGLEAILDTEWSGTIAKNANIKYVYVGNPAPADEPYGNVNDAVFYTIEENLAGIMSESFGGCEYGFAPQDADVLGTFGSAANLLGITFMASSGDQGAEGCAGYATGLYVDMPASFPGVTGVGGTEFPTSSITFGTNGYATGYPSPSPEEVWNESSASGPAAGGGGISSIFARPSYQSGIATCDILGSLPQNVTPATMRQVPDVSFPAADGENPILVECTLNAAAGDCSTTAGIESIIQIGGTSASSPAFTGAVALVSQATGGRLGNINPMLYSLFATTPSAFHDIVLGNNEVSCHPATDTGCPSGGVYGYAATTGYDCGSGLGSMNVTNLINAWTALTATTTDVKVTPTATTPGSNVTLAATVNGTGSEAIAGTVTFAFQSYLANGQFDQSWTIGTATVSGSTTSGTATLAAPMPVGLISQAAQGVNVVAMYGGDTHHLASTSSLAHVTFASTLNLCIQPGTLTVAPGARFLFAGAQGAPPIRWYLDDDGTCVYRGQGVNRICIEGSTLNENSGLFTAGTGQPGYVLVAALDSDGEETFSELTVGDPSEDAGPPPWGDDAGLTVSACPFAIDAGPLPPEDAGPDGEAEEDSGSPITGGDSGSPISTPDASSPTDSGGPISTSDSGQPSNTEDSGTGSGGGGSSNGCSCTTAGNDGGAPLGILAGVALGLGFVARRRRSRR